MKTKHIQYRLGLLIGLLSLNTLSSCINTTRQLGMGPWPSKGSKDDKNVENGRGGDSSKNSSSYSKYVSHGAAFVGGAAATAAAVVANHYIKGNNSNCPSNNGTQSSPWGSGRP